MSICMTHVLGAVFWTSGFTFHGDVVQNICFRMQQVIADNLYQILFNQYGC